jgi:hypothetical protein
MKIKMIFDIFRPKKDKVRRASQFPVPKPDRSGI